MTPLQRNMQRMADDNTRIESLESEVRLLKQSISAQRQSISAQRHAIGERDAGIARLRAALKPFADVARNLHDRAYVGGVIIDIEACRAAREALEET